MSDEPRNPTLVDDETGEDLHECNDCGVLIPVGWELCTRCERDEEKRRNPEPDSNRTLGLSYND